MDAVSLPLPPVTAWLIFTMTQIIIDSQTSDDIIFLFLTLQFKVFSTNMAGAGILLNQ